MDRRPVPGTNNRYYATPDGTIWSAWHGRIYPSGRRCYTYSMNDNARPYTDFRPLKPCNGYVTISPKQGEYERKTVASLVLCTFDRFPHGGEVAYHLDSNPNNNRIDNLKWTTRRAILTGVADTD
jgi:hypothetical protein